MIAPLADRVVALEQQGAWIRHEKGWTITQVGDKIALQPVSALAGSDAAPAPAVAAPAPAAAVAAVEPAPAAPAKSIPEYAKTLLKPQDVCWVADCTRKSKTVCSTKGCGRVLCW